MGWTAWIPTYGLALLLSALAIVRDRRTPDKRKVSVAALIWTASSILRASLLQGPASVALALLDVALVLALISLAWRSRHGWPVLAAMTQSLSAAALLAGVVDPRLGDEMAISVSTAATQLSALVLLAGAYASGLSRLQQAVSHEANLFVERFRTETERFTEAPHGAWPGGVARSAAHYVHVQLGNDVAECADIELIDGPIGALPQAPNGGHGERRFVEQAPALFAVEVVELTGADQPGDQHQPWPAAVNLQPHLAKRQVGDARRGRGYARVERPAHARLGTAAQ